MKTNVCPAVFLAKICWDCFDSCIKITFVQVALVVAQHRDERDQLSGIKLDVLDSALKKLSHVARRRKGQLSPWSPCK